jgi:transposase
MKASEKLYCGIDLHSNNNFIVIIDKDDNRFFEKKPPNESSKILMILKPYQKKLVGIVIESTFNWYWLVDALMDEGFKVKLANPAAIVQYSGMKHTDDRYDSFWLAHLLRLELIKEGYIFPRELRSLRDLMRKRIHLVQNRTTQILSIQNLYARNTGMKISCSTIKQLKPETVQEQFPNFNLAMAILSSLVVIKAFETQISGLEAVILSQVKLFPEFQKLMTVDGIGKILALTIMLETGNISRFKKVGNYASYCRTVSSKKTSNNKKKGVGNTKNGNKYLSWAYVEAANYFIRYNDSAKRYYQKKTAKTKQVVAIKAIAHKLSRACFFIMRDQTDFDVERLFKY